MKAFFLFFFLFFFSSSFSQDTIDFEAIDSLYREDQFYVGITYNFLNNKPDGVSQNSFSAGFTLGFLRDFPINKNRTFAIAPGLGLTYNNYKDNVVISESNNQISYNIVPSTDFDKNKLGLYFLDLPIEFRWRTSTFDSHKFWRVYTGVKLSYLLQSKSKFVSGPDTIKLSNNPDINKFHYGAYVSAGYNTFNVYAYYGLQDFFKNGNLNGKPLDLKTINIGLMFYIL
ncbi:porin family protein [Flavobacterium luminosum]|uniref:PorT family protein n=1 Tax=Flavobacterium luminosum TaxID=2949086 RepID=A0ABT0TP50_9FLAO|nr:porin family protein [Flavobacterium sp. HXWNR70]MCL9809272.1 PorT family protein [Flavobacterium sp. HXWNR70]